MEYRKGKHCVYVCDYHVVIATKYRRKIFNKGILEYFRYKLKEIGEYYPEIVVKEMNGEEDHIHMLVSIPPKMAVAQVVNIVKSNTSRWLKKKFEFLKKVYRGTDGIWSEGYFVSTVWINEEIIKAYIQNQWKEDAGQAKLVLG